MEDGISERKYDPVILDTCRWLLLELEGQMLWSATEDSWKERRSSWMDDVNAAVREKNLAKLYDLTRSLEHKIKYSQQSDDWKNWKRDYWLAMYLGDSSKGVDTPVTITQYVKGLMVFEGSLLHSGQSSSWKEDRRAIWLKKAKALMVPVEDVLFALDVLDQIHKCIDNTTVSQWGRDVDNACSNLYKCADVLDKVAKDTGIAQATGGGAAIGGGLLALGGLIAAPFTAGASLAATVAGTALAVGGGVTSFAATMVKHGWDKDQTKEGEKATKTVCKQAQILALCLSEYCKVMTEFQEYLNTPEGKELIAELRSVERVTTKVTKVIFQSGSKAVSLGLVGIEFTQAVRLMRVVSLLRPEIAGPLGSRLAMTAAASGLPKVSVKGITLFAGVAAGSLAAKALLSIGGVVTIGFGIWDVVSASEQVNKGSEIATQFRQLARDLNSTKNTICEQYQSLVE